MAEHLKIGVQIQKKKITIMKNYTNGKPEA